MKRTPPCASLSWPALSIACLAATAAPAFAEDTQDLGKMVISANRTATSVDTVGSSVTIIAAEEIEKKQAVTALDVIKDAPGINLYSNGGMGKSSGLYMRGMGYKNILVLIDGVEVADPSGSQTSYDLTHMQADNIERIEVLRGNQSTLYGSDAMGGVISITTKSGRGSKKPYAGTTSMEYGAYNTRKGDINVQGASGPVYYSGSVRSIFTDGFDISNTMPGDEKDGYKNCGADLRVGSDALTDVGVLDRLSIEGIGRILRADTQTDGSSTVDGIEQYRMFQRSGSLSATADIFGGVLSNHVAAAQSQSRRDYYKDHTRKTANPFFDGEKTKYEYQGTLKAIDDHTLVFGADHEREHMTTGSVSSHSVVNDGFFGDYQINLLDDSLTLTLGARQDDHEKFGDTTTYRSTAAYLLKETGTRFHTSYGTGFRAPSLYELYHPTYGRDTLKPEESSGYDVGIEQSLLDDRLTIDTTFFNTRMTNEIIYEATPKKYRNVASSRTFGVENLASFEISKEWWIGGSYTYQQARDNSTGMVLAVRAHHVGNVRVSYSPEEIAGLDTWVRSRMATWSYDSYANKSFTGGYAVIDFGASYAINDWSSVYGRVENVTDKLWHTKGEYAETGRAGYVGMRIKF